jgi:hypothetical protein
MPLDLCLVLPSAWPMLLLLIQPWLCIVFHLSDLCYLRSGQFHFGRLSTFHARHCSGVLLQRLKLVSVAHVILGQVLTSQLKVRSGRLFCCARCKQWSVLYVRRDKLGCKAWLANLSGLCKHLESLSIHKQLLLMLQTHMRSNTFAQRERTRTSTCHCSRLESPVSWRLR